MYGGGLTPRELLLLTPIGEWAGTDPVGLPGGELLLGVARPRAEVEVVLVVVEELGDEEGRARLLLGLEERKVGLRALGLGVHLGEGGRAHGFDAAPRHDDGVAGQRAEIDAQHREPVEGEVVVVTLEETGGRQDHIGVTGGLVQVRVDADHEVQ